MAHGMKEVEIRVKGPGSGRESAIRALQAIGLEIDGDGTNVLVAGNYIGVDVTGGAPLGNAIYMLGSNLEATRFSGVRTRRVTMKIYVLSSLLAGVAAVVMMSRFNSANASYGESYLLVTILAAVLGGIDPFGGFGKVSGLVLSLIILQVISSAFNLIGLSQFLTLAIWGVLLIATSVFALIYRTQFRR